MTKINTFEALAEASNVENLLTVCHLIYDTYTKKKKQPGAEHWSDWPTYKNKLHSDISLVWASLYLKPDYMCKLPWSEGFVTTAWKSVRKNKVKRLAFTIPEDIQLKYDYLEKKIYEQT